MATKKSASRCAPAPKRPDKMEKAFLAALESMEKIVKERMLAAADPLKVGLKMAKQIHDVAERVQDELRAEGLSHTEAAYTSHDEIGVGIGVL